MQNNDLQKEYLSPFHGNIYFKNLDGNAKKKYKAIYGKEFDGNVYFDIDNVDAIKYKSIHFKNGNIPAYKYDIWVEATPEMQKIIYYLGLGQNTSIGAGCLSYITGLYPKKEESINE